MVQKRINKLITCNLPISMLSILCFHLLKPKAVPISHFNSQIYYLDQTQIEISEYVKYMIFGLKYDNTTITTTNFNGGRFCKFLDDSILSSTFLKKMDFKIVILTTHF